MNDTQKKLLVKAISHLQTLQGWYKDFNDYATASGRWPVGIPVIEYASIYEEERMKCEAGQPYATLQDISKKLYRMRNKFEKAFPARLYINYMQDIGHCFKHINFCILSYFNRPCNPRNEQIRASQGVEINECLDFLKAQL